MRRGHCRPGSRSDNQRFVDALREWLDLAPLYAVEAERYQRIAFQLWLDSGGVRVHQEHVHAGRTPVRGSGA